MNEILDENFAADSTWRELDPRTLKNINLTKIAINDNIRFIRSGRWALVILIGVSLLSMWAGWYYNPYQVSLPAVLIEGSIFLAVYVGCLLYLKRKPKISYLVALVVYLLTILLNALVDPSSIFHGWIVRLVVIMYLSRALMHSIRFEGNLAKLHRWGVPAGEIEKAKQLELLPRTEMPAG